MKYLLGVGFVVTQKYKKDPIVRIKIDDTFLDEYTLDNCPNYNKQWARDTNIWIYQRDYTTYFHKKIQEDPPYALFNTKEVQADSQFPTNFKLYVLDEDKLKSKKLLEVEVQNADSNYTNGFMTKSTLLDFFTFLVPIPFIKFFSKGGEDIRKQFNEAIIDDRYAYTNYFLYLFMWERLHVRTYVSIPANYVSHTGQEEALELFIQIPKSVKMKF